MFLLGFGRLNMSCGEEANDSETIVCSVISDNEVCCNGTLYEHVQLLKYNEGWFWGYLGIYIFLMLFAGEFPRQV